MNPQSLARGLAFFSVGLGAAELLAPRQLARTIGVDEDNDNLLRLLGLREIGSGLGILQGSSATFVWSRVGGDLMDLALLGSALRSRRSDRTRVTRAIGAVAAVTVLDVLGAMLLSRNPAEPHWRVPRSDRSGMEREEPWTMRQNTDDAMAQYQSSHFGRQATTASRETQSSARTPHHEIARREQEAVEEFEPGD